MRHLRDDVHSRRLPDLSLKRFKQLHLAARKFVDTSYLSSELALDNEWIGLRGRDAPDTWDMTQLEDDGEDIYRDDVYCSVLQVP